MNKLDYLAQKEEELRKLKDQLDDRRDQMLQNSETKPTQDEIQNKEKMDLFANNAWTVNEPAPEEEKKQAPVDQEDDYEEDDFENQNAEELSQVQNYQKVLDENKEQKKIITVQKAKIQALQAELEDTLKQLNLKEIALDDQANKDGKITDEAKRYQTRIDNQDKQLNKLKQQNQELSQKYTDLQ